MGNKYTGVVAGLVFLIFCTAASAATITSASSGPWNVGSTWVGGSVPLATDNAIIGAAHIVNIPSGYTAAIVNVNFTAGSLNGIVVDLGGTLDFTGALTLGSGPPTRGTVTVNGILIVENGATMANASNPRLTIGATGIYRHAYTTTPGTLYPAKWNIGSTIEIVGYTSNSTFPAGISQPFYNFTWNCTNQAADIYFDGSMTSVLGNLDVTTTNGSTFGLTTTASTTLVIGGNLSIGSNSYFDMTGGSGNATIQLAGNFTLGVDDGLGNFGGAGTATLLFNGPATGQNFNSASLINSIINIEVANSSLLKIADGNFVSTSGTFTLDPSASVAVGSTSAAGAIQLGATNSGNIQVANANRIYNVSSNIVYNGLGAQKIGNGFPTTSVNLEINNAAGVTNNNIGVTNVVGDFTLTSGTFTIGPSNTLNIQSKLTITGGKLGGSPTSNLTFSGSGTVGTIVFATGTESLQDLTIGRTGTVVLGSDLDVKGNINLSFGNLDFSGHTLTMEGTTISSSGTGLVSTSALSNLVFTGSTFNSSVPFSGGSNQLNNLTFSTPGGIFNWGSVVTINGQLALTAGTINHTSGLTMAANSTFAKGGGTFSGVAPSAVASYNVAYSGTGATGVELPTSATALKDLTVNSSGTLTLTTPITINGNLNLLGGTFNAGSNAISLVGNLVSNASSTLTSSPFTFAGNTTVSGGSTPIFGAVTVTGTLTTSGSWQLNGNLVNNGVMNAGTGTTTFGGSTTISGSANSAFNNIIITAAGTLVAPISPVNFSVAGTWTNNGTFTNSNGTVVFNGTSTIGGVATTSFRNINITGALTSPTTLNVAGDFLNNGTFTAPILTTLNLNGTSIQQSIGGSTVTTFNNINVANVVGNSALTPAVQIQSNQNLRGVLTLGATSFFDADGSSNTSVFTLLSTADGNNTQGTQTADAAIATIPAAAGVTGNVTVQRYMSIEGASNNRIYRYISSPVTNATVAEIQATIPVTGAFPQSSACPGCGANPSMFSYDETLPGNLQAGYVAFPVASNTEILLPGHGYSIYERGNVAPISTAGSGLWSVTGPINAANVAPFVFPVTFTAQNGVADDGWNLIGNPFPSTIDWNAATGWSKSSDIQGTIYMTDNAAGSPAVTSVVATWNGTTSTNGGSRNIATGQAFYVKSDGSGTPSLTATENVKVAGTQTIYFREKAPENLLRITMAQDGQSDDIVIHFREDATDNFDGKADAYKLKNSIFNLSSLSQATKLAINSLPLLTCTRIVKLSVTDALPGKYHLDFSNMDSFDPSIKILLHDAKKGSEWIDVTQHAGYEFDVTADTTTVGADRFSVSFGYGDQLPVALTLASDASCADSGAKITVSNSVSSLNYFAKLNGTTITPIIAGNGDALKLSIASGVLKIGDNTVEVFSQSPHCATLTYSQNISIKTDSIYSVRNAIGGTSCLSGSVTLKATGASKDGTYNWYSDISDVAAAYTGLQFQTPNLQKTRTYYVSAVNSLGCEGARVPVVATVFNFDPATITTVDETTLKSNYSHKNHWFMDGQLLSDTTATLKVTATGTYKLVVDVGTCSTTDERTMIITGISEHGDLNGYPNPVAGNYTLEIADPQNEVKEVPVINSLGAKIGVLNLSSEGIMKIGQFDFTSYSSGFYYIKVAKGSKYTVLKVIKK